MKNILTTSWPKASGFGVFGEIDKLFSDVFGETIWDRFASVKTEYPMDYSYSESDSEIYIDIPLAGHKKEDIEVSISDGYLNVKVDGSTKRENVKYFRNGISSKTRKWSWDILDKGLEDSVSSKFEDGMLKITITKKIPVKPEVRKVEVQ